MSRYCIGCNATPPCPCGLPWSLSPRAVVDELVRNNLRLVHLVLRRRIYPQIGAARFRIGEAELESTGTLALLFAARRFDPARGFKFTTYATNPIYRNVWRFIRSETSRRERQFSDTFDAPDADHTSPEDVSPLLDLLNDRERFVIERTVMADETLALTGAALGITHQRVRQIRDAALEKLAATHGRVTMAGGMTSVTF